FETVILAKSNEGYKELIQISSRLEADGIREFNELFSETTELIVIVSANTSAITTDLHNGDFQKSQDWFKVFSEIFQQENVYIGLQRITDADDVLMNQVKQFAIETGIQVTALHDVRYVHKN